MLALPERQRVLWSGRPVRNESVQLLPGRSYFFFSVMMSRLVAGVFLRIALRSPPNGQELPSQPSFLDTNKRERFLSHADELLNRRTSQEQVSDHRVRADEESRNKA
jgi:hypothetical protein